MPDVISASRRTDIPAFYGQWFMNRVRQGHAAYRHPFNPSQIYTVSLAPEEVTAFVFWTKNPIPFLPHLEELDDRGYRFYFQFTITSLAGESLGRVLSPFEAQVPSPNDTLAAFKSLSSRYSPDHLQWRFDPIVISNVTPVRFHEERFARMCAELEGCTRRCYFSFPTFYGKVRRALGKLEREEGIQVEELPAEEKHAMARRLADIAASHGITMHACCAEDLVGDRIRKAHCVDADILSIITGSPVDPRRRPTRKECGCVASKDIGGYDTCTHGCVYCYANVNKTSAQKNREAHDPSDLLL